MNDYNPSWVDSNRPQIMREAIFLFIEELQKEMKFNEKVQDISDVIQGRLEEYLYNLIGYDKFKELCESIEEDVQKVYGKPWGYEERADIMLCDRTETE
jgi:hypothetical protein